MLISERYLADMRAMHAKKPFGVSGDIWASHVHDLMFQIEGKTLLDYGCGTGLLKQELERAYNPHYEIMEYDPAIDGKTDRPLHADVVVCGDVLEHIEPDCLYSVLDDLRAIARQAVFLVIATAPANKHLPDGRNAHLIVEPMMWWLPKLLDRWKINLLREMNRSFYCIGTPR